MGNAHKTLAEKRKITQGRTGHIGEDNIKMYVKAVIRTEFIWLKIESSGGVFPTQR
jgi:hypothetical protein